MRPAPVALILFAAFACGGRATLDDEAAGSDDSRSSGGASSGAANTSGGSVLSSGGVATFGGASFGGAPSSGGASSFGGAPSTFGGAPPSSGGSTARGGAPGSGGVTVVAGAAGSPSAGAGGETTCFTAVQSGEDYCFEVELCETVQREALCSLTEARDAVICSCFVDGSVRSRQTFALNRQTALCALAVAFECRGR